MATITGTNASDLHLDGTNLANQIFGLGGNDNLIGFNGDDVLEGGAGADQLFGSPGFDYASYRSSSAGVYVSLYDFVGKYGDAEGDQLYSIEGVIGSAYRDLLVGGDQADVLYGQGGATGSTTTRPILQRPQGAGTASSILQPGAGGQDRLSRHRRE